MDSDAEDEEMPLFFEDREGDALDNEDEDRAASDKDEDEDDEPAAQGRAEQEEEAGPSGRGAQPQSHKQPADGKKRRAPAWEDDNDGGQLVDVVKKKTLRKLRKKEDESALTAAEFEERLREQHRKLHPGTGKWAQLKGKAARGGAGSDSDDEEAEGAERRLTQSFGQALRKVSAENALPHTSLFPFHPHGSSMSTSYTHIYVHVHRALRCCPPRTWRQPVSVTPTNTSPPTP